METIKYKTARYVSLFPHGKGGFLGVGSKQTYIGNSKMWETISALLSKCKVPQTLSEVESSIRHLDKSDVEESMKILTISNSLVPDHLIDYNDRFSRNHLYYSYMGSTPSQVQAKISNSSVTIIGCGGIGNHIAYMLATSGVGTIHLVDDDHIEISNLTRQVLFTEEDIGQEKTHVLKRELLRRNSSTSVDITPISITKKQDLEKLEKSDLYIVSADYPAQLIDWVNEFCVENNQPYLNVGYMNDISVVGPFVVPTKTSCFRCASVSSNANDLNLNSDVKQLNEDFKAATFAPINGISANFATSEILKFIGEYSRPLSYNKRIGIYSDRLKIEEQTIEKNKECQVCGPTQTKSFS